MIESAGAIIVYSAPYTPEVIPIEFMFGQWKAVLKRHEFEFQANWFEIHCLAVASITRQQGLKYFKKTTLVELANKHPESSDNIQQSRKLFLVMLLNGEFDDIV